MDLWFHSVDDEPCRSDLLTSLPAVVKKRSDKTQYGISFNLYYIDPLKDTQTGLTTDSSDRLRT